MFKKILLALGLLGAMSAAAQTSVIRQDNVKIGRGTATDKKIILDKGSGAANPAIQWNNATGALQFSNDGTNYLDLGSGSGGSGGYSVLTNGDFESGISTGWTYSGATGTVASSGSNLLIGGKSAVFDATAGAEFFQSSLYTIPNGLYARNCYAQILYKGGDANLTLQVIDGSSNVLGSTVLAAATNPTKAYFNFICPSSGSMRLKILAGADAAAVALDSMFLGEAINIANISQAQAILIAKRSSSDQAIASVSPTAIVLNDDTLLDVYDEFNSSTGVWTAKSTKRIAVYANIYMDRVQNNEQIAIDVYKDGGAYCSSVTSTYATDTNLGGIVSACIIDVVAGTTIQLWVNSTADNDFDINQGNATRMTILQFPTTQEMAIRPDLQFWKVDANIYNANATLSTTDVPDYTRINSGSLILENNSGQGNINAEIPCATGTAPSGTTCSAADESIGIAFTPTGTFPQDVEVCVEFSLSVDNSASSAIDITFQLAETSTTDVVMLAEGRSRVNKYDNIASSLAQSPYNLCGTFTFASGGKKVIRLMYELDVTNTPDGIAILADRAANLGRRDIHFTARPINQGIPAPLLVGSVVSDSVNIKNGGDLGVTSIAYVEDNPTPVAVTNVAATSGSRWLWQRIGKVVIFAGRLTVDPTTGSNTLTDVAIPIPASMASDFSSSTIASGTCVGDTATGSSPNQSGFIYSDSASDRLRLVYNAADAGNREHRCTGMYFIQP